MANGQFSTIEDGSHRLETAITTSTGVGDASKIVQTGPDGKLDASLTTPVYGRRNIIINGNMRVNQRGETDVVLGNGSYIYIVDRHSHFVSATNTGQMRAATYLGIVDGLGSSHPYLRVWPHLSEPLTATNSQVQPFIYHVEARDMTQLLGGNATLSFYFHADASGTYAVSFKNHDATQSYVSLFTYDSADGWVRIEKTVDFTGLNMPSNLSSSGLKISIAAVTGGDFDAPSTDSWLTGNYFSHASCFLWSISQSVRMTGLQLEVGEQAMPFEISTYAEQLSRCQRYYYNNFDDGEAVGNSTPDTNRYIGSATNSSYTDTQHVEHPVPMRATPTVTFYSVLTDTAGQWALYTNAWYSGPTTLNRQNNKGYNASLHIAGVSFGTAYVVRGKFAAEAEL